MEVISHTELVSLWKRGMRNGALRRLSPIKRGLFSAAIDYSRIFGVIRNGDLIRMIKGVADRIGKGLGQRIWEAGLARAAFMIKNAKVMKVFPSVLRWTNQDDYIFWLGTHMLTRQRAWVLLLPANR